MLISYILSLYTSNSTTSKQLFNLPLYGSIKYSGKNPSLSILDISGYEEDAIYISYYIKSNNLGTITLKYEFTDTYPDEYFECACITQKTHSSTTKSNKKVTSLKLYFEIKKQNKKYLVLENIIYKGYEIEVNHHKNNPQIWMYALVIIFCILLIAGASFGVYTHCKNKKKKNLKILIFKKKRKKKRKSHLHFILPIKLMIQLKLILFQCNSHPMYHNLFLLK